MVGGAGVRVPRLHALRSPTVELEALMARGSWNARLEMEMTRRGDMDEHDGTDDDNDDRKFRWFDRTRAPVSLTRLMPALWQGKRIKRSKVEQKSMSLIIKYQE